MRLVLGLSLAFLACISVSSPPPPSAMASLEQWKKENKHAAERGNLLLRCEPEDAEILLDGIPQGNCSDYAAKGLQTEASPYLRKIVVSKAGYWPYEAMVALDSSRVNLNVRLQPMQADSVDP